MATTPTIPTKASWLKKLGQDFVKVFNVVAGVEKIAEVPIEALLPVTIPGFSIFDKVASLVGIAESNAALVGQASNGAAKLQSILTATGQLLDAYVTDNFPGSAEILKSETYLAGKTQVATQFVNTVVAFLNSLPADQSSSTGTSVVVQASAAVQAAKELATKKAA